MKKIVALLLTMLMICGVFALPASAAESKREKCPIIFIAGSSIDICDADGNIISTGFDVLTDDDEGDMSKDEIIEAVTNILIPFVTKGLPKDEWDDYGEALYEELAPIWDDTQLDGNGNAKYGTGVSAKEIADGDYNAQNVDHGKDGKFGLWDYKFRYDWRLSPYDHVDRLHQFIKDVIKTTGCSQVALVGRCLGGNVITAYLNTYGEEKLVKKVVFDEVMSNGSVVINDCFSGKVKFSDKHVQAYLLESEYYGKMGTGIDLIGVNDLLLEVANSLFDVLTQMGATQGILNGVYGLYERLYEALMPSMLLATGIGTWVSYWSSVSAEDLDTAVDLIFGKEGTERRAEYAGLVEKIYTIRDTFTIPRNLEGDDNLYKKYVKDYGVEIAVIAGYGLVNPPMVESADVNGDIVVDTKNSSFGATVAGVFDTLPQDYIDAQVAAGKGKYISPDGKVDTSTCLFPETTWIIKNKHHDIPSAWEAIAENFTQYSNFTADSNPKNYSRFLISTGKSRNEFENMTADNCADGIWLEEIEQEPTKETQASAFIRFFTALFKFLAEIFKGNFDAKFEF